MFRESTCIETASLSGGMTNTGGGICPTPTSSAEGGLSTAGVTRSRAEAYRKVIILLIAAAIPVVAWLFHGDGSDAPCVTGEWVELPNE